MGSSKKKSTSSSSRKNPTPPDSQDLPTTSLPERLPDGRFSKPKQTRSSYKAEEKKDDENTSDKKEKKETEPFVKPPVYRSSRLALIYAELEAEAIVDRDEAL